MIAFTFFSAFASGGQGQENDRAKQPAKAVRKPAKEGEILITLEWTELPLRETLLSFGKKYDVSIFLDRRIDPDQEITLSVVDVTAEQLLVRVAEKVKAGTSLLGKVHYLGPRQTASKLAAVAAQRRREVTRLPPQARVAWMKSKSLQWSAASQPGELTESLLADAGATLENPQLIPHDVWPAYSLHDLPLYERLTLVLAGFDLTWEISQDASKVRLLPLATAAAYASAHLLPGDGGGILPQMQRIFPKLKFERSGNRINVIATFEEHEQIDELLRTGQSKTVTKEQPINNFTLTVENQPAGAVLSTVAKKLSKEFKYDPSIREKLSQRVSFAVKEVSLDELLTKALKPLGLSYKMTETTLEVIPLP